MGAIVGIIANPASGKDIRRLVAHGSVFDNNEKVNIIQRVLRALDVLGIDAVLAMPDSFGLVAAAYDKARVGLRLQFLHMPVTHTQVDSTVAAQQMVAAGAGCIVTLGGDGTNRVVAKGCDYVPLVPVSTGTNNVFPVMVEGTLAGLAAGVVALNVPGVRAAAVRMARRLEIRQHGQLIDIALVDVIAYHERFVASRAIWDVSKIQAVILAQAQPGIIGGAAIAAYLPEIAESRGRGAWLELDAHGSDRQVWVPIAPGLIQPVFIKSMRWLDVGQHAVYDHAPAVLALDGEREVTLRQGEHVEIQLTQDGPHVVDVTAALRAASQAGVFLNLKGGALPQP